MSDLEPITRAENFWVNEGDLEPITRKEQYIKHLYDETQVVPEYPKTREEYFINKAGEELHDVTIEQLTATENKTYSEEGVAYSPVIVDVPLPDNAYLLKDIPNTPSPIATFTDGSALPMPKLEVSIEPQQDLHGYDYPWPAGAGKNKADIADKNVQSQTTMGRLTLPSGTYVASATVKNNTSIGGAIKINTSSETLAVGEIPSVSGTSRVSTESFTLSKSTEIVVVVSGAVSGYNYDVSQVQIELGTIATSYAPYSNICPISGWDEVNVTRCGKNLFDKTATDTNKGFISGKWINQTGNTFLYADWSVSEYIRVDGEKIAVSEMTVAEQVSAGRGGYCCYDKNKNVLGGGTYNALTQIITLPTNTEYIRISVWKQNKDVCQLEIGNTPTTYEPYNGSTITIQLGDTYYGGTLDVVSGVLTLTHGYIASYNGETLPSTWISDRDVYAEGTTPTIGAEVCYELATPTTIQLTPTAVKSLLGSNNIWADTGDVVDGQYFSKEV